jgi:hypothetical protein
MNDHACTLRIVITLRAVRSLYYCTPVIDGRYAYANVLPVFTVGKKRKEKTNKMKHRRTCGGWAVKLPVMMMTMGADFE